MRSTTPTTSTASRGGPVTGPSARWFVARALDGWGPKLALFDAAIVTLAVVVIAIGWRVAGGSHAGYEDLVPLLGMGLRWSVGLPIAWGALGAIEADRRSGLLGLALRRGVSARRWLLGRALGTGALVFASIAGPMVLLSLLLAGFGGGLEGALARASLVFPSLLVAAATALVFGVGAAALGALFPSRWQVIAVVLGAAAVGGLVQLAVPGAVGASAHQLTSPFFALDDLQAAAFDAPGSRGRGITGLCAVLVMSLAALQVAAMSCAADGERARLEGG
jgi:hypothetical protein